MYRRTLGVLAWTFATLHMVLFQIYCITQGTLANNAWLRTDNYISSGTMDNPIKVYTNNFRIPIMEFTWLVSLLTLSCAMLRFAYSYELFVYTHYLMLLFFALSFLHAFQSWYYTGAGLLLYMFDKCLRLVNSSRSHKVVSLQYYSSARVTRVRLPSNVFGSKGFGAGLFCWINIPAISMLE